MYLLTHFIIYYSSDNVRQGVQRERKSEDQLRDESGLFMAKWLVFLVIFFPTNR